MCLSKAKKLTVNFFYIRYVHVIKEKHTPEPGSQKEGLTL